MKKFLKLFCMVLACIMLLALAAACSNPDEKLESDEKGVYYLDEDGVKVYKVIMMDHGVPFTTNQFKYRERVMDVINEKLYKDLGYKVDITVEVYADDTFADKLATRLADGDQLDLVRQTQKQNLNSYVDQGIAKNLDQYMETAENLKENLSASIIKEVSYDGSVYAIPLDQLPVNTVTYVRGDLLDKAGYDALTTLQDWEGFLKKVKDGGTEYLNSKMETVPLMGNLNSMQEMFLAYFTDTPGSFFDGENNMLPKYFNDGYKQFILKMREWMKEGYIDSSLFSFNEFGMNSYISNQITAAVACGIYSLEFGSLNTVNKAHPEWEISPLLPIKNTDGKYASQGLMGEYLFVPYCAKSAGVAVDLIDWMLFNEENYMLMRCGIEGVTYTVDENKVIDIPEAEKSESITSPSDLIGRFTCATSVEYNMGYPSASCPIGAKEAYAQSLEITDDELYVDPSIYVTSFLSDTEMAQLTSANSDADKVIQQLLTMQGNALQISDAQFEATWEKMLSDYTNAAGSVYEKLTQEYNKMFA